MLIMNRCSELRAFLTALCEKVQLAFGNAARDATGLSFAEQGYNMILGIGYC